jgi:hypothetical protein
MGCSKGAGITRHQHAIAYVGALTASVFYDRIRRVRRWPRLVVMGTALRGRRSPADGVGREGKPIGVDPSRTDQSRPVHSRRDSPRISPHAAWDLLGAPDELGNSISYTGYGHYPLSAASAARCATALGR